MCGGDIITWKVWLVALFVLCTSLTGISFGALNILDAADLGTINFIQPASQADRDNSQLFNRTVNAKHIFKRGGILSVTAQCSCSLYADYEIYDSEWLNYCPECHSYGTLIFDRPEDCPEGMIRCTCCDADFCAVHGKEHVYRYPKFLTPV